MSETLLDCLAGKLTNMGQVTGYVSQLEGKLKEREDKIKQLRKCSGKLLAIIVEDAIDQYDELIEKFGESDPYALELKQDLDWLHKIIASKAAEKVANTPKPHCPIHTFVTPDKCGCDKRTA